MYMQFGCRRSVSMSLMDDDHKFMSAKLGYGRKAQFSRPIQRLLGSE